MSNNQINYIKRKSDGKYLVDVRADGRVVLNIYRDKALQYPTEKLDLAKHTLASLGEEFEIEYQIQVNPEVRFLSTEAQNCINNVIKANPQTREEAAAIIRRHGFYGYQGGHHVALINGKATLAIFTSAAPDFN